MLEAMTATGDPIATRRGVVVALLLAATALLGAPAAAGAQLGATACGESGFLCGELSVPLDRGGTVPGTVALKLSRLPVAAAPTDEAVVALAGGPGQAALPVAGSLARALEPLHRTRDLIVYDQRGTGASGPLNCTVRGWPRTTRAVGACARQLGPARGSFRTADSVEDIEALRVAGGYQRLVIYGVSYGTKVALMPTTVVAHVTPYPHRECLLGARAVMLCPDPVAQDLQ